jgi:N-methylhydantoinase B/oxoprolinase/acetone carboxylase alpha subunit
VAIPQGTILKPRKPAAISCRTWMLGRIFDIMGGLLGQGSPDALNAAGTLDKAATSALREKVKRGRPETLLFNFGGTIEEIKALCRRQTGLEPPKTPVFPRAM